MDWGQVRKEVGVSVDSQLILQSGLCSVLHGVVGQPERFLHGKSTGVQKLQEHFNISAHDTVQDAVFFAVLPQSFRRARRSLQRLLRC